MIDLKAARAHPDVVRAAVARKGGEEVFDELLRADEDWRRLNTQVDELRARTKLKGKPTPEQLEELTRIKPELQALEDRLREAEVLREVGTPHDFGFEPRDHLDIGTALGWFDQERGARLSGTRFVYRMGDAALIELALYRFALDRLVARGFVPVLPPVLVREQAMYGTGFLPTDDVNI